MRGSGINSRSRVLRLSGFVRPEHCYICNHDGVRGQFESQHKRKHVGAGTHQKRIVAAIFVYFVGGGLTQYRSCQSGP